MIFCLDQGGVDQILQNLGLLEFERKRVALLLGRLIDGTNLMVLMRSRQNAIYAEHLTIRLAVSLYSF